MRILLLDIETAPNIAYVWGLWQQNVATNQLVDSSYILCWAAKWYGKKEIQFSSIHKTTPKEMLLKVHKLLDEADAVVHYNGTKFDIPILNKEFVSYDIVPPSPYKQIDLLRVARGRFRFASNKLDFVANSLGLGEKIRHKGFELWVECMQGNSEAWQTMKNYNIGDVKLLEKVYVKMLPWIKNHPNHGLYKDDALVCSNCGSSSYQSRGWAMVRTLRYRRFQCNDCGTWFRGNKSEPSKSTNKFIGIA